MRVKATFLHVFEVTREVEVDDEEFARLYTHQANRERDTSDEYLLPLLLNTQEVEYLADVFPDWKTTAPLPDDFVLQYTDVTEAERVTGSNESSDAGPLGSGHSPRATAREAGDCGGSVEDPSTHLIHGPASDPSVQEPEHANGAACPTCDVDENAPNPACASWVHPNNGPSQDHTNGSTNV